MDLFDFNKIISIYKILELIFEKMFLKLFLFKNEILLKWLTRHEFYPLITKIEFCLFLVSIG